MFDFVSIDPRFLDLVETVPVGEPLPIQAIDCTTGVPGNPTGFADHKWQHDNTHTTFLGAPVKPRTIRPREHYLLRNAADEWFIGQATSSAPLPLGDRQEIGLGAVSPFLKFDGWEHHTPDSYAEFTGWAPIGFIPEAFRPLPGDTKDTREGKRAAYWRHRELVRGIQGLHRAEGEKLGRSGEGLLIEILNDVGLQVRTENVCVVPAHVTIHTRRSSLAQSGPLAYFKDTYTGVLTVVVDEPLYGQTLTDGDVYAAVRTMYYGTFDDQDFRSVEVRLPSNYEPQRKVRRLIVEGGAA